MNCPHCNGPVQYIRNPGRTDMLVCDRCNWTAPASAEMARDYPLERIGATLSRIEVQLAEFANIANKLIEQRKDDERG